MASSMRDIAALLGGGSRMGRGMPSASSFVVRWILSGQLQKEPATRNGGSRFRTAAASVIRSSTMSRVHSAIRRLRPLAVELCALLPDQFALRPGEPLVVENDGPKA